MVTPSLAPAVRADGRGFSAPKTPPDGVLDSAIPEPQKRKSSFANSWVVLSWSHYATPSSDVKREVTDDVACWAHALSNFFEDVSLDPIRLRIMLAYPASAGLRKSAEGQPIS